MASEIFHNDGGKIPDEITRRLLDSDEVLTVRLDRKRAKLIFMGTDVLTEVLSRGVPLEQYLTEKVAQAREALVKEN
jgi:hypothetical protein